MAQDLLMKVRVTESLKSDQVSRQLERGISSNTACSMKLLKLCMQPVGLLYTDFSLVQRTVLKSPSSQFYSQIGDVCKFDVG